MYQNAYKSRKTRTTKLLGETKDLNKWGNILQSLIGKLNIMKIQFTPNRLYRLNTIHSKCDIDAKFHIDMQRN